MNGLPREGRRTEARRRGHVLPAVAGVLMLVGSGISASAGATLTRVSADPYTNTSSQHHTQVEPDTFSYGSTIVSGFQSGRFYSGGSTNIGFATSTNSGASWTSSGFLKGITTAAGGTYDRVSDPSVAYDAAHGVWLIASLPLTGTSNSFTGLGVVVNRSTDGGLTWGTPQTVVSTATPGWTGADLDKDWIVCDNSAGSRYYGHCYVEFDNHAQSDRFYMSTSSDGALSWSAPKPTADAATGLGGQPVVQPNGNVIVPAATSSLGSIISFGSSDGGGSWSNSVTVASSPSHTVAANLRTGSLPTAEIDGAGRVYVAWEDCRFERSCKANDIVLTSSTDGTTWSSVARIPIDAVGSGVDHFVPGLAVDPATSGSTAHLILTYYYYPKTGCTTSTCQLMVGYSSSVNAGRTWSGGVNLAGPMKVSWLPNTSAGYMVGDYISTSFAGGSGHTVFPVAGALTSPCPVSGQCFTQAMVSPGSLTASGGAAAVTSGGIATNVSDHAVPRTAERRH